MYEYSIIQRIILLKMTFWIPQGKVNSYSMQVRWANVLMSNFLRI